MELLTADDINLMSRTYREEIASLRTVSAFFIREIKEDNGDPYQNGGSTLKEVTDDLPTDIVWVPVKATDSTTMINGVQIENGDVTATVDGNIDENVVKIGYEHVTYRIVAKSPLGIGDINRTELLLRKVT